MAFNHHFYWCFSLHSHFSVHAAIQSNETNFMPGSLLLITFTRAGIIMAIVIVSKVGRVDNFSFPSCNIITDFHYSWRYYYSELTAFIVLFEFPIVVSALFKFCRCAMRESRSPVLKSLQMILVGDRDNKEGWARFSSFVCPLAFILVSGLVGASMMDALSRCVLEPRPANDYRALAATLVSPFLCHCRPSCLACHDASVCWINQPRAKTDREKSGVRWSRVCAVDEREREIVDDDEEAATKKRVKSERKREKKERKRGGTRFKAICYFN